MKTKRINDLEKLILRHKNFYYQGCPEIPDEEFDQLENELRALDPDHYVLNLVGSLTLAVDKVKHDKKMLSLNKTYSVDDLLKWIDNHGVVGMYKIDGISCSLIYEYGQLKLAKTRGDGVWGENITSKVLWMEEVPKTLENKISLEIRGELYCHEEGFRCLGGEMQDRGLERPTNPRNIVAGLMGRKDNIDLAKHLSFFAYDVIGGDDFKKEAEKFKFLELESFKTPFFKTFSNRDDIIQFLDDVLSFMSQGNFTIDGAVFAFNDLGLHEELGETNHHPRYKMAFKWAGETKTSTINKIIWQVSRNGTLTPVADIVPVNLSGADISKVTLHNFGVVKQNLLKEGDLIKIIRSGEVIPKFLAVVESSNKTFEYPTVCPSCGNKVDEVDIRLICRNSKCGAKNKESILHFVKNIGIDDLSDKRLMVLIDKALVVAIEDLYRLKIEDLLELEKTKEKLATKIVNSIQKTKRVDLVTFLTALGINGGARGKCEKIVNFGFNTIEKVLDLTVDSLMEVDSFAEKSAQEFIRSLNEKRGLVDKLIDLGMLITPLDSGLKNQESPLFEKKVCITGTLSMKRSILEKMIKDVGGVIQGSVTKNTNFLITNEKESSSSKFKMAKKLSIPILSEEDLIAKLKS